MRYLIATILLICCFIFASGQNTEPATYVSATPLQHNDSASRLLIWVTTGIGIPEGKFASLNSPMSIGAFSPKNGGGYDNMGGFAMTGNSLITAFIDIPIKHTNIGLGLSAGYETYNFDFQGYAESVNLGTVSYYNASSQFYSYYSPLTIFSGNASPYKLFNLLGGCFGNIPSKTVLFDFRLLAGVSFITSPALNYTYRAEDANGDTSRGSAQVLQASVVAFTIDVGTDVKVKVTKHILATLGIDYMHSYSTFSISTLTTSNGSTTTTISNASNYISIFNAKVGIGYRL